jgi:hypothetical protein
MSRKLLALAVSALTLGVGAGPAMADVPLSGQLAEQVAGSQQSATSNANSTQINPNNTNISVRVLSPGDDGDVTQTNESGAGSFAGNSNDTTQTADQSQGGAGGVGVQESGQLAGNHQWADSNAESTQVAPQNRNINVRVLSEGNNGSVDQSNESKAKSFAGNKNTLTQDVTQDQSGSMCCPHPGKSMDDGYGDKHGDKQDSCGCQSGVGIQAGGQEAYNKQKAESNAESKQIKPTNQNISVRVLSPGDDGDVSQSNSSTALSGAFNKNDTSQSIDQSQSASGRCGCSDGVGIQAGGQKAFNWQHADSNAESKQIHPTNKALSLRFKSEGYGGALSQSNSSFAGSLAANKNVLSQTLTQSQSS